MRALMKRRPIFRHVLSIALGLAFFISASHAGTQLPGFYENPGLDPNRSTVSYNYDEHIDPFNGMLQLHHVDMVIPGNGGMDLKIQRSYFSPTAQFLNMSDTMYYNRTPNVGVGWNLLIGGRVFAAIGTGGACSGGNQMSFETPDGKRQGLLRRLDGTFISTARWKAVCVVGGVHVFAPNGTRYEMLQAITEVIPGTIQTAPFLYPTKIVDRNGNEIAFAYDSSSGQTQLVQVNTSDGRQLTFAYSQLGAVKVLHTVTDGTRTWTYSYDSTAAFVDPATQIGVAYFLTRVEPPSGGPWIYEHYPCWHDGPAACAMGKVTYPEGGHMVYEYDQVNFNDGSGNTPVVSNRAVAGAVVLQGESANVWTYAYTPGTLGVNATTTVTSNLGKLVYKHVGYSTVSAGSTWQVGLLMEKRTQTSSGSDLQVETLTWDKQQISSYPTIRAFGQNDGVTYAPLLTQRKLVRGPQYTTTYSNFDQFGNPQTIVESGQRSRTTTRSYFIDETKWIVSQPGNETITGLGTISRSFDPSGNLLNETKFGVSTSFTYTSQGDLASRTDARNKTTSYGAHHRGVAQSETRPESVTVSRTVDTFGNILSETDGAGNAYAYTYDALRRLTQKAPPIGTATSISWTGSNIRTATRGASIQESHFDGVGLPYLVRNDGIPTGFAHNAAASRTFESLPGRYVDNGDGTYTIGGTTTPRDMLGRVTQVRHIDGTYRSVGYSGATISETDELLRQTNRAFVAFGDPDKAFLTTITQPNANVTSMTRNDAGQVTSVTKDGKTRTYTYNGSFFLTAVADPETGTTTFGRDEVGNMTSRTTGSRTTTFAYDGLNRLIGIAYPNSDTVVITYLGNGRTATVINPAATRSYVYDSNANLTSETLAVGSQSFTVTYTYDANDQLATIRYPRTNETVDYAANPRGLPSKAAPYVTAVTYFDSGLPMEMQYATGVKMTFEEDVRQRPGRLKASKPGALKFLDKQYGYDAVGNVKQIRDFAESIQSVDMTYDSIDQLVRVDGPWGVSAMTYDRGGNLQYYEVGSVSALSYTYGPDNKLQVVGFKSFAYDVYGNVTSDGSHTYQYDDASNLVCVDCGTANEIRYAYDGNNMRVSRTKGSDVTYYVHAASGDLLLEYTPSRSEAVQHVYLHGKRIATKRVTM